MQHEQRLSTYVKTVPSMLSNDVCIYLEALGSQHTGEGIVVECGCWLGGSTAHLALGLTRAQYSGQIWCYDRWSADAREVLKAARFDVVLSEGQNLQPLFEKNLAPIGVPVIAHRGPIQMAKTPDQPIEIFLLDAAKRPKAFFATLARFAPNWIPGKTIIGFMDLFHYRNVPRDHAGKFSHQAYFLSNSADVFEVVQSFPDDEPVFVRYRGGLDFHMLEELSNTL